MKKFTQLLILLSFLLASTSAYSQEATTSLDEFMNAYYEAIGGKDAWKGKLSLKTTGTVTMYGTTYPVTSYTMRPNMHKVEIEYQGNKIIESFDGDIAWSHAFGDQPKKKSDEETKIASKQMFEEALIDWKAKGHQASLIGTEIVGGAEMVKLELVKKSGDVVTYFFDKKTHLPLMTRIVITEGALEGKVIETRMSDYRQVEDIVMYFSMEETIDGEPFLRINTSEVQFNVPLEKESFMMPKQ